jgi:hypothetical protein
MVSKVSVHQFEPTLRFIGDDSHQVGDLHELRGRILSSSSNLDLGTLVLKAKQLAGAFEVLE